MKKIPLHKKLLLGAVTGGLGYGSYKLFKHTDAGSRKMEMISPVTPLLLVADDERRKATIAGGVGAGVGAAGASRLFKAPYAKSVDKAAGEVAGHINSLKDDLGKTPWYKFGKKRAIKSEIADVFKAGQSDIVRTISKGRKAGVAGAVVGGIVGGVAGAGLYASRHDLKNKINNLYNKTISKENRPNLVKSSDSKYRDLYIPYGAVGGTLAGAALSSPVFGSIYGGAVHLKRAITEKNNIKSSEAQESLRRVNEIIAGLTVKQATPIFKKIVAKKKALGASTSQAQKAALKILHRIDK